MDRRTFLSSGLLLMPAPKFGLPPPPQEQFGALSWHKWAKDVSDRLSGTFYLPNPYPDRIYVKGNYNGIGQVGIIQEVFSGNHAWALFAHAEARSQAVLGPVVGAGLQGFHATGSTTAPYPGVWGIATEAVSGTLEEEPVGSATLQNELSISSQFHNNGAALVGCNIVFKNRSDTRLAGVPIHGVLGSNGYNRYSIGLQFDSQPRSSLGEYCGFRYGIFFGATSLDRTVDGLATAIDITQVPAARLASAIAMAADHYIHFEATRNIGVKYDGTNAKVGFYIGGTPVCAVNNDGTGKMNFLAYTNGAANAGAAALPANPVAFWIVNLGGTDYKIPYYNV